MSATGNHEHQLAASSAAAERGGRVVALDHPAVDAHPAVVPLRVRARRAARLARGASARPVAERLPAARRTRRCGRRLDAGAHSDEAGVLAEPGAAGSASRSRRRSPTETTRVRRSDRRRRSRREPRRRRRSTRCSTSWSPTGCAPGSGPSCPPRTTPPGRRAPTVWRDPRAVVGASDAGAHLDMFCMAGLLDVPRRPRRARPRAAVDRGGGAAAHRRPGAALRPHRTRPHRAGRARRSRACSTRPPSGPGRERTLDDLPVARAGSWSRAHGVERVLVAGTEIVRDDAWLHRRDPRHRAAPRPLTPRRSERRRRCRDRSSVRSCCSSAVLRPTAPGCLQAAPRRVPRHHRAGFTGDNVVYVTRATRTWRGTSSIPGIYLLGRRGDQHRPAGEADPAAGRSARAPEVPAVLDPEFSPGRMAEREPDARVVVNEIIDTFARQGRMRFPRGLRHATALDDLPPADGPAAQGPHHVPAVAGQHDRARRARRASRWRFGAGRRRRRRAGAEASARADRRRRVCAAHRVWRTHRRAARERRARDRVLDAGRGRSAASAMPLDSRSALPRRARPARDRAVDVLRPCTPETTRRSRPAGVRGCCDGGATDRPHAGRCRSRSARHRRDRRPAGAAGTGSQLGPRARGSVVGIPVFLVQHWWIYQYSMFLRARSASSRRTASTPHASDRRPAGPRGCEVAADRLGGRRAASCCVPAARSASQANARDVVDPRVDAVTVERPSRSCTSRRGAALRDAPRLGRGTSHRGPSTARRRLRRSANPLDL